jgi:5'-3' exonuclease
MEGSPDIPADVVYFKMNAIVHPCQLRAAVWKDFHWQFL